MWRLSPTFENPGSENSEDQASLIQVVRNNNNNNNNSKSNSGKHQSNSVQPSDETTTITTLRSIDSSPPAHHKAFVKIPLEDRTKYEKLGSNDITSDDNSDSEFFTNEPQQLHSTKKNNFKQIVSNNIHEKIQAVYHKVEVQPIVRKLKIKSGVKRDVADRSFNPKETATAATTAADQNSDNDSIGSASDLQKTEEDAFDADDAGGQSMNTMADGAGGTLKRYQKKQFDDGISESVRTCGSSAYHAECESVATNEDDISRVVVRVRMRKKDRMNDSTNTIIDENQLSPSSAELLHQYGDKPLLLDDELDYDSGDNSNADSSSKEEPSPGEELDVFAMAPFKMPKKVAKKARQPKRIVNDPITGLSSSANLFETPLEAIWTSTPKKQMKPELAAPNVYTEYRQNNLAENTEPLDIDVSPQHQAPSAPQQPITLPKVTTNLDDFNEPVFNPFPSFNILDNIQSASHFGLVTVVNTNPNSSFVRIAQSAPSKTGQDLFGSEPFPEVIKKAELPSLIVERNNNQLPDYLPSPSLSGSSANSQVSLVTVNQSIVIDKFQEPSNIVTSVPSPRKFINYTHLDKSSYRHVGQMLPIADNEYISAPNNFNCDEEEEEVLASSSLSSSKTSKKDKGSVKYGKSKIRDDSTSGAASTSVRVVLPALIAAKVKGNSLSYKKVSSVKNKKQDNTNVSSVGTTTLEYQIGFNNMSFEDFPSDQELDILNPSDGANRTKTTPFEVIRNEKMLLEAEKKFGSLKRRTNLFS